MKPKGPGLSEAPHTEPEKRARSGRLGLTNQQEPGQPAMQLLRTRTGVNDRKTGRVHRAGAAKAASQKKKLGAMFAPRPPACFNAERKPASANVRKWSKAPC